MKIYKDNISVNVLGNKNDAYKTDSGCQILIGKENGLYHLSISHYKRNPTWEEIKRARYDLLSRTKTFAMLLPPPDEYVNVHKFCFHLYELTEKEKNNIGQKNEM